MASIGNLSSATSVSETASTASRPPAAASADLAKLESQLSDWVHCASCNTSAGKAKIAEISDKIEAIKSQVKKADEDKAATAPSTVTQELQKVAAQGLRFDGLGVWLNEQV